jgi:hypothetical protein
MATSVWTACNASSTSGLKLPGSGVGDEAAEEIGAQALNQGAAPPVKAVTAPKPASRKKSRRLNGLK